MRRSDRSSGLFLCACLVTVMCCPGGDDAGGRASTAHAQPRRPGCANRLRNNRGGQWVSGAAAAGHRRCRRRIPSRRSPEFFFTETNFHYVSNATKIDRNAISIKYVTLRTAGISSIECTKKKKGGTSRATRIPEDVTSRQPAIPNL